MADAFEIEAPPPLSKFNETVIHAHNRELMADENARPLTKAELKAIRRRADELATLLAEAKYYEGKSTLETLRQQFNALRIDLHNAEAEQADTAPITESLKVIKRRYRSIYKAIAPYRSQAAKLNRLNRRIHEHHTAIANKKLSDQLRRDMAKEARLFASIIQDKWTQLGYCYRYTIDKTQYTDRVQFDYCVVTEDEIQLKVLVSSRTLLGSTKNHLPREVAAWDLIKEETLRELTIACERNIRAPNHDMDYNLQNGAWLVVDRLGFSDGIMEYVPLPDVLSRYQQDKRHRFPLPMGVKRGRVINWVDLVKHPHLFVNGQTGTGKSNVFNVIITTLIQMHSPDEVRLILIDLKEGAEFLRYAEVPHVWGPIITEIPQVENTLIRLEAARRERMQLIRRIAPDIDAYNMVVPEERRIPRIVVMFDEYGAVSLDATAAKVIRNYTSQLATKARAAGIHLIIGTQTPYNDTVPKETKANITFALVGRQRTPGSSMSSTGTGKARELVNVPGRMLCDDGAHDLFQVQIPHCRPEDTAAAIKAAHDWPAPRPLELPTAGEEDTAPMDAVETPRDLIIRTALEAFEGALKSRRIWEHLGSAEISRPTVERVVKEIITENVITWRGATYQTMKKEGNFYALVATDTSSQAGKDASNLGTDLETDLETEMGAI